MANFDLSYEKLNATLQTEEGQRYYARVKHDYEQKYERQSIQNLDYSTYKLIYKTGNRTKFDALYHAKRERLNMLQFLALGDDRYLEPLEDIIASICDEYTWVISAHAYAEDQGKAEEFDYTRVCIFSSSTAVYLAETDAIFGDKLSMDIRKRIRDCVYTKVLAHFEERTFWWEGKLGSNWTPICAHDIGLAYMYLFPKRFILQKARIFALFQQYIDRCFTDDGVCAEGAGYYSAGMLYVVLFADSYKQAYGKFPPFMQSKKLENIFAYQKRRIVDGWLLPFGDLAPDEKASFGLEELITKKIRPDYVLPKYNFVDDAKYSVYAFTTRLLDAIGRFDVTGKNANDERVAEHCKVFEQSQLLICKKKKYLFFAKGGHNNEIHNHNDIGTFAMYVNDKRIIPDIGSGEYTWEYGQVMEARYGEKIFCCGSCGHNVPILDGQYQTYGDGTQSKLVAVQENGMTIDIAPAYGLQNERLLVQYTCEDDFARVAYTYQGEKKRITFRILSNFEPKTVDGRVYLDEIEVRCNVPYELSYTLREWKRSKGMCSVWTVDFTMSVDGEVNARFDFIPTKNK